MGTVMCTCNLSLNFPIEKEILLSFEGHGSSSPLYCIKRYLDYDEEEEEKKKGVSNFLTIDRLEDVTIIV